MRNNRRLGVPVRDLRAGDVATKPVSVSDWEITDPDQRQWWTTYTHELRDGSEVTVVVDSEGEVLAAADDNDRMVEFNHSTQGYLPSIESYLEDDDEGQPGWLTRDQLVDLEENTEYVEDMSPPLMNYWYPVDGLDESNAVEAAFLLHHLPLCVVMVDDTYGLALTGGGMDLSWEICEAYCVLGMLPPAHFSDLPHMAGRDGDNEPDPTPSRDLYVFQAMVQSLNVLTGQLARQAQRLREGYSFPTGEIIKAEPIVVLDQSDLIVMERRLGLRQMEGTPASISFMIDGGLMVKVDGDMWTPPIGTMLATD